MDTPPQNPIDASEVELKPSKDGGPNWFDKKHVITYIIVLVGLATIGGAIYAYQKTVSKQEAVNNNQTATQVSTAGWKTYTNTEYGFEFKYPNTSRVDNCGDEGAVYIDQDCDDLNSPEPMALIFENVGNADSLVVSYTEIFKNLTNNNYQKTIKQIDGEVDVAIVSP